MKLTSDCAPTVTREKATAASEFMKRLANPTRLMIACALVEGERSVGELEIELGLKQPALSQQLAELRDAGIVEGRREVKQVFYRLSDPRAVELIATLHRLFCSEELSLPSATVAAAMLAAPAAKIKPPTPVAPRDRSPEAARFARVSPPETTV
jgi:DNA-binding transcriptional ArsR family regulator